MKSVIANSVLNYLGSLSLCNLDIQFLELCSHFIKKLALNRFQKVIISRNGISMYS